MSYLAPILTRPADPGNHGSRDNISIDTLVLHVTESKRDTRQLAAIAIPSAVLWFADPAAKASAHYVVGQDGHVWQCVAEGDCAWHAGNLAVNRRSIGIEIEGFTADAGTFTPMVMDAVVSLSAEIVQRHGIPVLRQPGPGICGHADVPDPTNPNLRGGKGHHTDPGPAFPWEAYFGALRQTLNPPAV